MMLRSISILWLLATPAHGQSAYEIQVYGSDTVERGETFSELHSNTVTKGPTSDSGLLQPDRDALHETLELTHGFTDWFETGFYVFTSARNGEGWQWVGDHVRPRVRAPESWHWPVGVSLSAEAGYLRPRFAESRWDMEIRPIIDWRRGQFYISINPAFERAIRLYGTEGSRSFQFAPALKLSWDITHALAIGIEYYGNLGPAENASPASQQQHQIYIIGDLLNSKVWEVNAGIGPGLTAATDRLAIKVIVGRKL